MADMFYRPRRPGILINVHVVDIVSVMKQEEVLNAMSEDELLEIARAVHAEHLVREKQQVR